MSNAAIYGKNENGEWVPITSKTLSEGSNAALVESLPNEQEDVVPNDSTVLDLMGIRCRIAGNIAIKMTNDSTAFVWTVIAGEIIYGRIVAVMDTGTDVAFDGGDKIIGLK